MFPCKTWPGREGAVTELTGSWRLVAVLTTLPCCQRKLSWWSREPPHQSVLSPRGPSLRREITTRITHKSLSLTSHSRDSQQIITTTDTTQNWNSRENFLLNSALDRRLTWSSPVCNCQASLPVSNTRRRRSIRGELADRGGSSGWSSSGSQHSLEAFFISDPRISNTTAPSPSAERQPLLSQTVKIVDTPVVFSSLVVKIKKLTDLIRLTLSQGYTAWLVRIRLSSPPTENVRAGYISLRTVLYLSKISYGDWWVSHGVFTELQTRIVNENIDKLQS